MIEKKTEMILSLLNKWQKYLNLFYIIMINFKVSLWYVIASA